MTDPSPDGKTRVADFAKRLFAGSLEIGASLLPLIGAYAKVRHDPEWKKKALLDWITQDPNAVEILQQALTQVRTHINQDARNVLILALGGIPLPE